MARCSANCRSLVTAPVALLLPGPRQRMTNDCVGARRLRSTRAIEFLDELFCTWDCLCLHALTTPIALCRLSSFRAVLQAKLWSRRTGQLYATCEAEDTFSDYTRRKGTIHLCSVFSEHSARLDEVASGSSAQRPCGNTLTHAQVEAMTAAVPAACHRAEEDAEHIHEHREGSGSASIRTAGRQGGERGRREVRRKQNWP